jgi:hypothetical protein
MSGRRAADRRWRTRRAAASNVSDNWAARWNYERTLSITSGPKLGGGCAHYALIEHWNGATWSVISHPDDSLAESEIVGMAAIASNDVWAVGYDRDTVSGNEEIFAMRLGFQPV